MAQLEHLFVKGLRFDTEIQYQVCGANQLGYENLPIHQSASARTCALASLVQCVAVLGQVPAKDARELMRAAQRTLSRRLPRGHESAPDEVDDETLLHVFDALCTPTAELHVASDGKDLGAIAQSALRAGWVGLLGFDSARSSMWAMVTGVELNRLDGQSRALLLLDSGASRPWACAHNVRIELQAEAGRAVRASPGFRLNCRHLTGEACAVRLRSLIVLRSASVQG